MSNNRFLTFTLIIIFLVVTIPFIGFGCTTKYKEVTITRRGIHCSFEYPVSYSEYSNSFQSENLNCIVVHYLPNENTNKEIRIDTFIPDTQYPNANIFLESFLENTSKSSIQPEILEYYKIKISGIDCNIIIYSATYYDLLLNSPYIKIWDIYMDYKGYIWNLKLISTIDVSGEAEIEFQHFIDTFQFLD